MFQLIWKRAVVAAALGLAAWAGSAHAQDYERAPDFETAHPYLLLNPNTPHPLLARFNLQAPLGCWSSHNEFGCSSLLSETVFVFGSCRAYYNEPCLKAPPPPPWSPAADYPPPNTGSKGHW